MVAPINGNVLDAVHNEAVRKGCLAPLLKQRHFMPNLPELIGPFADQKISQVDQEVWYISGSNLEDKIITAFNNSRLMLLD